MKSYRLLVLAFLAWSTCLQAQMDLKESVSPVGGRWEGVLTQKKGGFLPEYRIILVLSVSGDQVTGFSEVWYGESIYVKSEVQGSITRGVFLELEDRQVLNRKDLRDFEYCRKTYQLVLDKSRQGYLLKGRWQGETDRGACIPGSVRLERRAARV